MTRLYLDNAATSLPKPPSVYAALHKYATQLGATPGRGNYREAREGGQLIYQCRQRFCQLIGASSPSHIIFTLNCTDANNLAIQGVVRHARRKSPHSPIHIITTDLDHNSVLRPIRDMEQDGIRWTCINSDPVSGIINPADIAAAITPDTLLVALTHASNILGTIQPAAEVGRICRNRNVLFFLDAAQTAGHVPINVNELSVDLLSAPGHKGLLGPLGTGLLYIRPGIEHRLDSLRQGGTGSQSELDTQPTRLPDKYEPGSHNAPGIVALSEALAWLLEQRIESLRDHEIELNSRMFRGMHSIPAFTILGPQDPAARVGIFTLTHESLDPHTLATILEDEFGILARAGLHCAPRAHAASGTDSSGGLRLSVSPFTTLQDIDRVLAALTRINATMPLTVQ